MRFTADHGEVPKGLCGHTVNSKSNNHIYKISKNTWMTHILTFIPNIRNITRIKQPYTHLIENKNTSHITQMLKDKLDWKHEGGGTNFTGARDTAESMTDRTDASVSDATSLNFCC
jgi:hypothetical protein